MGASSAHADTFGITASQTYGLTDNQVISVKVNGLPMDKGIYVKECVLTDGKVSSNPKDCTSSQNTGSALWFSFSPGGWNSSNAQNFKVVRTINGKDCTVNSCAIVTLRDHIAPSDRTYDSITPITVGSISFALNKSAGLVDAGDQVSVSVSGLAADKGIYIRQCEIPANGTRPTRCDSTSQLWASNVATDITELEAADASKEIKLNVSGRFIAAGLYTDCQLVTCGVYVQHDFADLSDRSLDAITTISFAPTIKVKQDVSSWKTAPKALTIKAGKFVSLAKFNVTSTKGYPITWTTSNPKSCKIVQTSTLINATALKAGSCVITATAPLTSRTFEKKFTWTVTVK